MSSVPISIVLACASSCALAQGDYVPVMDSYTKEFAFGSPAAKVTFHQNTFTEVYGSVPYTIYEVFCFVELNSFDDAILAASQPSAAFPEGGRIDGTRLAYPPPQTSSRPYLIVGDYSWSQSAANQHYVQGVQSEPFAGLKNVIVGFRVGRGDQARFGWIRLHRDNPWIAMFPTPATGLATPFVPVDAAINPFPKKSIAAGQPPELPTLDLSTVPDTGEGRRLRIRWADGYPGVRLQHAAGLESPVKWEDLNAATNDVMVQAPAEGGGYYRLLYDY